MLCSLKSMAFTIFRTFALSVFLGWGAILHAHVIAALSSTRSYKYNTSQGASLNILPIITQSRQFSKERTKG